jgi:hypothetical protein
MTDSELRKILGAAGRDPGCDAGLDLIDEYCELVHRGAAVPLDRFGGFLMHIGNCVACHEDTESLLAVLRDQDERER